jgi:hypothetical protein
MVGVRAYYVALSDCCATESVIRGMSRIAAIEKAKTFRGWKEVTTPQPVGSQRITYLVCEHYPNCSDPLPGMEGE